MREMKCKNRSSLRERIEKSLIFGIGAGVLTFLCAVLKEKLGMTYNYTVPKTWSQIAASLPFVIYFSLGVSVVVLIGTFFFYKDEEVMICPICEEPFKKTEVSDNKCPKCGVDLVRIKGYYRGKKCKD
jgi:hypothetical protein